MGTIVQNWARRRNFLKMRLMGARAALCFNEVLTRGEAYLLERADDLLREVLENWQERNEISKKTFYRKNGGKIK